MEKRLMDYCNHVTNVLDLGKGFTIGREVLNGSEFIIVEYKGAVIYGFWNNPKKKASKNPPKHTGGKPSYVKLMIDGIRKHNLSLDAAGFLVKLADNIQWNTNLLINKRNKKPLIVDDISGIVGVGRNKTLNIIKELTEAQLLSKDKDGYKISPSLIQKGGKRGDNNK